MVFRSLLLIIGNKAKNVDSRRGRDGSKFGQVHEAARPKSPRARAPATFAHLVEVAFPAQAFEHLQCPSLHAQPNPGPQALFPLRLLGREPKQLHG